MSSTNYLPAGQNQLAAFTAQLYTQMAANAVACSMTPDLLTAYQTAQEAYAAALITATGTTTRTPASIQVKDGLKAALIAMTREYVNICQASPLMTDEIRVELNIPIRDYDPTPVPVPTQMPQILVNQVSGRLISLQLLDQDDEKRRPDGVKAANLFSYAGESPPADLKQWTFEGASTRLDPQITISDSVAPGTTIYITALWVNTKLQPGPACTPIKTKTNFDGMSMNQAA